MKKDLPENALGIVNPKRLKLYSTGASREKIKGYRFKRNE